MSFEDIDHYLWIMLEKSLLVVVSILMNSEDADSAREISTSSNQYFFSLNSEFSIAWWVESKTRILTRLEINIELSYEIDIEYSSRVMTLISSTRASQKVGMKTRLDDQSMNDKNLCSNRTLMSRTFKSTYLLIITNHSSMFKIDTIKTLSSLINQLWYSLHSDLHEHQANHFWLILDNE